MVVESIPIEMFAGLFLMIFRKQDQNCNNFSPFLSQVDCEKRILFNKTFKIPKIVVIARYLVFGYL